jgi:hypothetical protein
MWGGWRLRFVGRRRPGKGISVTPRSALWGILAGTFGAALARPAAGVGLAAVVGALVFLRSGRLSDGLVAEGCGMLAAILAGLSDPSLAFLCGGLAAFLLAAAWLLRLAPGMAREEHANAIRAHEISAGNGGLPPPPRAPGNEAGAPAALAGCQAKVARATYRP